MYPREWPIYMLTLCSLQCSLCCLVYIELCHVRSETLYYSVCQTFSRPDLFKALLDNVRAMRLHGHHAPPFKLVSEHRHGDMSRLRASCCAFSLLACSAKCHTPLHGSSYGLGLAITRMYWHSHTCFPAYLYLTWCIIFISTLIDCYYSELL